MDDWAEVHRLFDREGRPKAAIARQLAMSRNTVDRLLRLTEPPRYERPPKGSQLDPFAGTIAALLAADPRVPATVICERLRADGYRGGITILKDHLSSIRPGVPRRPGLPADVVSAGRDRPGRLVAHGRVGPGRPGPDPARHSDS
ncbi:MAG TPA: hypothetical protein VEX41_07365 [Candidatus Eisenbacteria bacterium]|nr:hypothetical protein [Candidatus Eisenbacteria bacterium]